MKKYLLYPLLIITALAAVACSKDDDTQWEEPITPESPNGPQEPEKKYHNGYEYVDLGLSVKWAAYNVGTSSPEGYGNYYAWGETTTKSDYSKSSYQYLNGSDYVNIGSNISDTHYDAARAQWGGSWRLPTKAEFQELIDRCTWTWTSYNGVNGYKVTGPNGNSIFLPAAGHRRDTELYDRGSYGYYWSGSLYESNPGLAYYLSFNSVRRRVGINCREYGCTVRPVMKYSNNNDDESTDDEEDNNNSGNGSSSSYENPDVGFYDYTATRTSLKVQYRIYNKSEAGVTSARIYYGTSSNPTSSKSATISGTMATANISGLKAGTTYYVKCVVTGKGGTTTTTTTRLMTNY